MSNPLYDEEQYGHLPSVIQVQQQQQQTSLLAEMTMNPLYEDERFEHGAQHLPAVLKTSDSSSAARSADWTQYYTDDGVPYYVSAITGESRWDCPS
jgi:hypothetical protein